MDLKLLIRTIPDYPKPGIMFRDITTLLENPLGFSQSIENLSELCSDIEFNIIAGIEARGFIIGSALAFNLSKGFVPIRKKGKLPGETVGINYNLEYGSDRIEIHKDSIVENQKILLVDDLVATGGTALASIELLKEMGAIVSSCLFLVDLPDLGGSKLINQRGIPVKHLLEFEGD